MTGYWIGGAVKVLFVDDKLDSVIDAREAVESGACATCECCGFDAAGSKLDSFQPDVAVIDLYHGDPPGGDVVGGHTCALVWDHRFCPIVVYSAMPDALDDGRFKDHPFVRLVTKGRGSPDLVVTAVQSFAAHISALGEVQSDFRSHMLIALRDTAKQIFSTYSDEQERSKALKRAVMRRVAARIDEARDDGTQLAGWEQYLFPPLSEDVMLGDILISKDVLSGELPAYFLVLTPSCDLVQSAGRHPRVANVLAARCCNMEDAAKYFGLQKDSAPKTWKEKLPAQLSRGFVDSVIPLPRLPGLFDPMAADLRGLVLIPLSDIEHGGVRDDARYKRVASIDSPFRELVAWANVSVAGRPGLPDRDFTKWAGVVADMIGRPHGSGTP